MYAYKVLLTNTCNMYEIKILLYPTACYEMSIIPVYYFSHTLDLDIILRQAVSKHYYYYYYYKV